MEVCGRQCDHPAHLDLERIAELVNLLWLVLQRPQWRPSEHHIALDVLVVDAHDGDGLLVHLHCKSSHEFVIARLTRRVQRQLHAGDAAVEWA